MPTTTIEREIKLRFASADEARAAILACGGTPLLGRRLQEDALLDSDDEALRRRRCVLRVRMENGKSRLTFKGPVQPGIMKIREELETVVGDGDILLRVLKELGLHVWFRYEKYREEFAREDVIVAIDETPVGVLRRDRGQRDRHRLDGRGPRRGRSRTTSGTRTAASSCSSAKRSASPARTWCSTNRMPAADRRAPRALLLTAGLGTRLRPLTTVRAKAAVPINGEALVRRVIRGLAATGVRDIVLNLHYRPASIAALVGDGSDLGVRVRYSWEQPLLGSAGGPRHALALLADADDDDFLIVNGDTLTDVDIWSLVARHRESGALVTMALIPNPRPDHYGGVLSADRRGDYGFHESPSAGDGWRRTAHVSFHRRPGRERTRRSRRLDDGVPAESVNALYPRLIAEQPGSVAAYVSRGVVPRHRHAARLPRHVARASSSGRGPIRRRADARSRIRRCSSAAWYGMM